MELKNKVVLITGASGGIGYAVAEKLADGGSLLILIARRIEMLKKFIKDKEIPEARVLALNCDVTDPVQVKKSIADALDRFGRIDVAILNAGISYRTKEYDSAAGKKIMDVNFNGAVNCLQELIPLMKKQGKGLIAGVSSLAEGRGYSRSGFYSASKAALSILLESLRVELSASDIKVITIKPGFVRTPMTAKNEFDMPFLMDADKAAGIIIRGIEKEKRIIQFPLPTVISAKLIKIMPDFLFEYLAGLHTRRFTKKITT